MSQGGFNLFGGPGVQRSFMTNEGSPAPYQQLPPNGLNFAGMRNAVAIPPQTQRNGQLVALAAVLLLSQASGVFDYDIDVCFADNTTAKTVRLRAVLIPGGPLVAGFGVGFGVDFPGSGVGNPALLDQINAYYGPANLPAINQGAQSAAQLNQDSSGLSTSGLLFNNFAAESSGAVPLIDTVPNSLILWDQEVDTLSGELSNGDGAFHAHGRCGFAAGVPAAGFGPENWVILVLELVSAEAEEEADVVTFGSCSMSLAEVG